MLKERFNFKVKTDFRVMVNTDEISDQSALSLRSRFASSDGIPEEDNIINKKEFQAVSTICDYKQPLPSKN